MSFKKNSRGKWYNGNGKRIRNPKAYARAIYGRPYKYMWHSSTSIRKSRKRWW